MSTKIHRKNSSKNSASKCVGAGRCPSSVSAFRLALGPSAIRDASNPFFKRSEEHTSELQSQSNLVCRLLLEKQNRSEVGIGIRKLDNVITSIQIFNSVVIAFSPSND